MSNSTHSEIKQIQKICAILSRLQITTFFQVRIFSTGKFIVLANSRHVYSAFDSGQLNSDYYFQLINNNHHGVIKVSIWPSDSSNQFITKLREMNIYHGVSISYALDNYIDIFSFATVQPNEGIINIYLNNLHLLKRFIVYFRFKATKLLERKTALGMSLNKKLRLCTNSSCDHLAQLTVFKNKLVSRYIEATLSKKENKKIVLTKKEMECLSHLLVGKSIKIVAEQLNVSRKTVEAWLKKIKSKTGFYTKDQLISIFNHDALLMDII